MNSIFFSIILLGLLCLATFICYTVTLVSFAIAIWDKSSKKLRFACKYLVVSLIFSVILLMYEGDRLQALMHGIFG
jgi:hypothetical protein